MVAFDFVVERMVPELRRHGAKMVKFAVVGVLNTAIDIGLFSVFLYTFGWHLLVANTLSYTIAATNSYALNKLWTFGDKTAGRDSAVVFAKFIVFNLTGLGLANVSIWLFALVMPPIAAKVLTIGVTFAWNYWTSHSFVFRRT